LKETGRYDRTAILISADHGGHERTHGTDVAEDLHIPWIVAGPGVPAGERIEKPVSLCDLPATAADLLGLDIPADWGWDGKTVWGK
jgi:arylsulfatase A-like enzyme